MLHYSLKTILPIVFILFFEGVNFSQEVLHVPINGRMMVYAPTIHKIIIFGRPGLSGDEQLFSVDAYTGEFAPINDFNLDIRKMAISPDGSLLYLNVNSLDSGIVVMNVSTMTIAYTFSLRHSPTEDKYFVLDMSISHQDPNAVAILSYPQLNTGYDKDIRIFDHGVPRPVYIYRSFFVNNLEWLPDKPIIYTTGTSDFFRLFYDTQGVHDSDTSFYNLYSDTKMILFDHKLYAKGGKVIDADQNVPVHYGDIPEFGDYKFLIDEVNSRVLRLNQTNDSLVIKAYDAKRLSYLGLKWNVPVIGPDIRAFIKLGPGPAFAVSTEEQIIDQKGLYIVRLCDQLPPPPVLDPKYNDLILLCNEPGKKIAVPPPTGYNFIIDDDGNRKDSLIITQTGSYNIRVMDANGCISKPSSYIHVSAGTTPSAPVIQYWDGTKLTKATSLLACVDGANYLRTGESTVNSTHWSTGFIGETYITDFEGTLWATLESKEGCVSEKSNLVQIFPSSSVAPGPPVIFSETGLSVCNNNEEVKLKASSTYAQFHWIIGTAHKKDSIISVGDQGAKSIFLSVKNGAGCWSEFSTAEISFHDYFPPTPKINLNLNKLAASLSAYKYEWYKDDKPLPDSDKQIWTVNTSGAYKVRIFDGVCWSSFSSKKIIP